MSVLLLSANATAMQGRLHSRRISSVVVAWLALFLPADMVASVASAETVKNLPGVVWQRDLGDERFDHWAKAMTPARDKGLWIAGTAVPASAKGLNGKFWLWKLDRQGKIERRSILGISDRQVPLNGAYTYIKALVEIEDGLLILAEFTPGQPNLLRVDKNGKVVLSRKLYSAGRDVVYSKIVRALDQTFYLMGQRSGNVVIQKIGGDGVRVWEKEIDRGRYEYIVDAVSSDNGKFVITLNSGKFDRFGIGPSRVWLMQLDADGNVEKEREFEGRDGILARRSDGYALVYDADPSIRQDIRIKAIRNSFEDDWETRITAVSQGLDPFRLISVGNDEFIVAGSNDLRLQVARVDSTGAVVWTYLAEATSDIWSADALVSAGDEVYVLSQVMNVTAERRLARKLGILKFTGSKPASDKSDLNS